MEDEIVIGKVRVDEVDFEALLGRLAEDMPSRVADLELAACTGYFDRYATNLGGDPSMMELSLIRFDWDRKDAEQFHLAVRNEHGGGIRYSEKLPRFTQSADLAMALAAKMAEASGVGVDMSFSTRADGRQKATVRFGEVTSEATTLPVALCSALAGHMHRRQQLALQVMRTPGPGFVR